MVSGRRTFRLAVALTGAAAERGAALTARPSAPPVYGAALVRLCVNADCMVTSPQQEGWPELPHSGPVRE